MQTVKLCTYTRGFYPTIWGYRCYTVIGVYLVIIDGKIVRRSFCEMGYNKEGEYRGEFDALKSGLDWVEKNVKGARETEIQVLFCGANRDKCKKLVDKNGIHFHENPVESEIPLENYIYELTNKFKKVTYYATSKVDEVKLYDMANTIFDLLYGDCGFKHDVFSPFEEDGITKQMLIGQPEIHCADGMPKSMWVWA
jgi:hypothetical protein